jgi:hypothetical protein
MNKASKSVNAMKQDLGCQKDDLSMVITATSIDDTELVKDEVITTEVEVPLEEPVPAEAPKSKKISMKKRLSNKLTGMKKVVSFRTAKPKVVVKAEKV